MHLAKTVTHAVVDAVAERDASLSVGPFDVDLVGTDGVAGRPTSGIAEQVRGWRPRKDPRKSVGQREKSVERSRGVSDERYDRPGPLGSVAGFVRSARRAVVDFSESS